MNRFSFLALLALACAGADDNFDDSYEADGGMGTAEQALGNKTSATYSAGHETGTLRMCRKTVAPSGSCILPGVTNIKFKVEGTDNCTTHTSWQYQVRRAMNDSLKFQTQFDYGWPFQVSEVTSNPTVTFRDGVCPGAYTSNSIKDFVCVSYGATTTVTESLPGTYKRLDGAMTITIDVAKLRDRVGWLPGSCTYGNGDFHQIVEHAAHVAGLLPFGSGVYVGAAQDEFGYEAWSTPVVQPNSVIGPYDTGNYPNGQLCRIGSWSSGPVTSAYAPIDSSCPDLN